MKIQLIGATHEVTGGCTLLEVCGKKYLVDCGMEQGIDAATCEQKHFLSGLGNRLHSLQCPKRYRTEGS